MTKNTRKNSPPIKVYCLPDERKDIEIQAKAAGLSASSYLRKVGLGYEIKGILDHQRIDELAKINADLGRLGGLLKLWLTNDERLTHFKKIDMQDTILVVLEKINGTQDEIREVIKELVLK